MASEEISPRNVQEFLAWERKQEFRHESIDGVVSMRERASFRHSEIAASLMDELGMQLRGFDCRVLGSMMGILCDKPEVYRDVEFSPDADDATE